MIQIINKSECCGCHSCENICPKKCITMEKDDEGFLYPKINEDKCIGCDLCEKVCPVINDIDIEPFNSIAYACKNRNENIRLNSSSGGVFWLLCKAIISNNGVVFGAAFDEKFNVRHSFAETLYECEQYRGSKYVQSIIGDMYFKVKKFLDSGKIVLFSGTQCQIKGLSLYLQKKYINLITVDIICHGVPSPNVFELYKEYLKKTINYNSEITSIKFRDKEKGWKEFSCVAEFDNENRYSKTLKEDIFMRGFLKDLYLRPSCYNCKAKNYKSTSDISLADYWGVENKHSEFDDDKGISLVLVNTEKGKKILSSITDEVNIIETDLQYAIDNNPCIVRSVKYNPRREDFFKLIKKKDIEICINKCIEPNLIMRAKSKFIRMLNVIKNENL